MRSWLERRSPPVVEATVSPRKAEAPDEPRALPRDDEPERERGDVVGELGAEAVVDGIDFVTIDPIPERCDLRAVGWVDPEPFVPLRTAHRYRREHTLAAASAVEAIRNADVVELEE